MMQRTACITLRVPLRRICLVARATYLRLCLRYQLIAEAIYLRLRLRFASSAVSVERKGPWREARNSRQTKSAQRPSARCGPGAQGPRRRVELVTRHKSLVTGGSCLLVCPRLRLTLSTLRSGSSSFSLFALSHLHTFHPRLATKNNPDGFLTGLRHEAIFFTYSPLDLPQGPGGVIFCPCRPSLPPSEPLLSSTAKTFSGRPSRLLATRIPTTMWRPWRRLLQVTTVGICSARAFIRECQTPWTTRRGITFGPPSFCK